MANGLPQLPSSVNVFAGVALLTSDLISLSSFQPPPQWGIYLDGEPVVVADNVMTFGFRKSARISKYTQEQGAFASYNKVVLPGEPKIKYSTGGSLADRQAFLASIEPLISDTNLYDVVTPEVTYPSYNVINYDYPRSAESAGMIEVDIWLEEVVVVGQSMLSNTTAPSDQSQSNNGLVNPANYNGPI